MQGEASRARGGGEDAGWKTKGKTMGKRGMQAALYTLGHKGKCGERSAMVMRGYQGGTLGLWGAATASQRCARQERLMRGAKAGAWHGSGVQLVSKCLSSGSMAYR